NVIKSAEGRDDRRVRAGCVHRRERRVTARTQDRVLAIQLQMGPCDSRSDPKMARDLVAGGHAERSQARLQEARVEGGVGKSVRREVEVDVARLAEMHAQTQPRGDRLGSGAGPEVRRGPERIAGAYRPGSPAKQAAHRFR